MVHAGEDALICDLAEQYGVFNWRAHGARLVATLATGLRPHARIWPLLNIAGPADAARGFESGADFDAAREKIMKAR